jgi:hypothetical protein
MSRIASNYWKVIGVAGALAGVVAWPVTSQAQLGGVTGTVTNTTGTITGTTDTLTGTAGTLTGSTGTLTGSTGTLTTGGSQAAASTAVVMGTVTSLVDTGTLTSPSEPLGTGLAFGSIPGLLTAESLHSAVMGWTDQVVSEASLSNLLLTVAGTGISADFIMSRAQTVAGAGASGLTSIEGLTIGGMPISPTGIPNQLISLPGLSVILNEQIQSASGIIVNALRVRTLDGLTNVVLGSSKAGL